MINAKERYGFLRTPIDGEPNKTKNRCPGNNCEYDEIERATTGARRWECRACGHEVLGKPNPHYDTNPAKIAEKTLTDSSKVYDVILKVDGFNRKVHISAIDLEHATLIADALNGALSITD